MVEYPHGSHPWPGRWHVLWSSWGIWAFSSHYLSYQLHFSFYQTDPSNHCGLFLQQSGDHYHANHAPRVWDCGAKWHNCWWLWYLLQNYRYCSKVPKPHNLVLYIPGQQDTKSTKPLTVQEIHNVKFDPLAKQFVKAHPTQSTTFNNPKMVAAWVQLLINGKVICQWFLPASRQAAATADYMEYLRIRFTWTHADTWTVSWPMLHLALQTLPHHDQQCIMLFIHNKLL